jgi:hypothetical protein
MRHPIPGRGSVKRLGTISAVQGVAEEKQDAHSVARKALDVCGVEASDGSAYLKLRSGLPCVSVDRPSPRARGFARTSLPSRPRGRVGRDAGHAANSSERWPGRAGRRRGGGRGPRPTLASTRATASRVSATLPELKTDSALFDQTHAPAAARAGHDVNREHSLQQPRPGVPRTGCGRGLDIRGRNRLAVERESQLHRRTLRGRRTRDHPARAEDSPLLIRCELWLAPRAPRGSGRC